MSEWDTLARYNAERSRGIMHTPEWQAKMAAEQERFDALYGRLCACGHTRASHASDGQCIGCTGTACA